MRILSLRLRFCCVLAPLNVNIGLALVDALNLYIGERETTVLSKIKLLICANVFFVLSAASAQAGVWDWAFLGSGSTPDFARGSSDDGRYH